MIVAHRHDTHAEVGGSERRTQIVVGITFVVMVLELVVGQISGSLALTADGWHMATHAGALSLSALAYWFARANARKDRFTFGTGKVYALAGFSSAVLLGVAAVWMAVEAVRRLIAPEAVAFDEALPVAVLGLGVNVLSIWLLGHDHDHGHEHAREHDHEHDHDHDHDHARGAERSRRLPEHDHNLRAVYLHVLADALTSVFAIVALVCGRMFGWVFLDPLMGILGGVLIVRWGLQLGAEAAGQLLDVNVDPAMAQRIRRELESRDGVRVLDLHLWSLGPKCRGCIVAVASPNEQDTPSLRSRVLAVADVTHLTVEVHRSGDAT